jgi:hypothetical protein
MSNPADCTIGDSVQVKINNMVKYESLSVYQIKNDRGTYSTVRRIWNFLFDILTMIHI